MYSTTGTSRRRSQREQLVIPGAERVRRRYECDRRLGQAVLYWAATAVRDEARAFEHYQALKATRKTHWRCLRGVLDRLLRAMCSAMRAGQDYDAARRAAG